jgi:molybdate transport system regulatory protein
MKAGNVTVGVRLRVVLEPHIAIGPGKADLLEAIAADGSISAAAKRMGMSYKRAWLLVETMNACFRSPLVSAAKGGRAGGGAELTRLGAEVLATYRRMEAAATRAVHPELARLRRQVRPAGPASRTR